MCAQNNSIIKRTFANCLERAGAQSWTVSKYRKNLWPCTEKLTARPRERSEPLSIIQSPTAPVLNTQYGISGAAVQITVQKWSVGQWLGPLKGSQKPVKIINCLSRSANESYHRRVSGWLPLQRHLEGGVPLEANGCWGDTLSSQAFPSGPST